VLIAEFNGIPKPNPEHCMDFAWIPLVNKAWMLKVKSYAVWSIVGIDAMFDKVREYINKKRGKIDSK
jgi:hypothetical protein